ncbi:MAG: signal recognition particle-docking protein FtsY [Pseudomonadota bacterium]
MNMFRKITLLSLFLALMMLVVGTYVRLSGAGAGCPDWPGCYGSAIVPSGADAIREAQNAYPDSPMDTTKAWKVMSHRYIGGALVLMVLVLAAMSWRQKHCRAAAVSVAVVLLLLTALQVALSMWIVSLKGMPVLVLGQLLAGMAMASVLHWLYLRANPNLAKATERLGPGGLSIFAFSVLFFEIILGGWTSANYASLACTDFPKCHGSWWPQANYSDAFVFWRGLFGDPASAMLSYEARVAIHWTHRLGAVVAFVILGGLVFSATASRNHSRVKRAGTILSVLLLVQVGLGVVGIRQGMPLPIAVAHTAVAALMLMVLVQIRFYSRRILTDALEPIGEQPAPVVTEPSAQGAVPVALQEAPALRQPMPELEVEGYLEQEPENLYRRLKTQLKRTRAGLGVVFAGMPFGQKTIDEGLLEDIEANLLMADVGVEATTQIIDDLTASLEHHQLKDIEALHSKLTEILLSMLQPCNHALNISQNGSPFVILVVGVNGVGKTTTIGKLAKRLQAQGHSVMLAAGDTFRAAAVEQLQAWGQRNNIQVIAQHTGADSASVVYDAMQAAKARHVDVLIADTAGRLHTKSNLMEELRKIRRIIAKLDETAPHEVLLVLDAGTGQNALSQAEQFNLAVELTGIALTKLDGTAKGGIIFALAKKFGIPIRFIGIGEGIDDLQDFDAESFVSALFATD